MSSFTWNRSVALVFLLAGLAAPDRALADAAQTPLGGLALFNRCYAHLTQRRLPRNHYLRAAVIGGMNPITACMEVFDKATLLTSGENEGRLEVDFKSYADPNRAAQERSDGAAVLKTFNQVHQLWFPANRPFISPDVSEDARATPDLHDFTEPPLHVTRAMFSPAVPYSSVVTSTEGVDAIRSGGEHNMDKIRTGGTFVPGAGTNIKGYASDFNTFVDLGAGFIQTGELRGIQKMSKNPTRQNLTTYSNANPNNTYVITDKSTSPYTYFYKHQLTSDYPNWVPGMLKEPVAVNQCQTQNGDGTPTPCGGGIMGTISYLLGNYGRPEMMPANGGIRVPRRWAKAVFRDLMCRELPAMRGTDANQFVQTNPSTQAPPFRRTPSCMACHATMDTAAGTARNLNELLIKTPLEAVQTYSHYVFGSWTIRLGAENCGTTAAPLACDPDKGLWVDNDLRFAQRPPTGRLVYRTVNGDWVNLPVDNMADLGAKISNQDDLYVCAASRYFKYFTGIGVNLGDPGTFKAPLLPAEDTYRRQVITWGQALRQNQTLRTLIQTILSSPIYGRASMRDPATP
jgi:hypothetical protein